MTTTICPVPLSSLICYVIFGSLYAPRVDVRFYSHAKFSTIHLRGLREVLVWIVLTFCQVALILGSNRLSEPARTKSAKMTADTAIGLRR